jgi:membrane-bound lytic murein transglycosylase D
MLRFFSVLIFVLFISATWAQHNLSGPAATSEDSLNNTCFLDEFEQNMRQFYLQYASLDEYEQIRKQLNYEPGHVPSFSAKEYCQRLMKMNEYSDYPFDCHPTVIAAIEDFGMRRRSTIKIALGRSKLYFEMMETILDKHGLPTELKYLSVVESMLLPKAKSRAGALGLWQFMYGTGKMFGLVENSFIDERMDPIKATEAACLYLKKLYSIYSDWNLALAAYNAGPGNVNKAIRRAEGRSTYWEVRPFLPKETQDYVPRFMAIAYLMEHHVVHNIVPAEAKLTYYDLDTVCLRKGVQMQRVEALVGITVPEIQMLNPVYKGTYIPKTEPNQCITLPLEKIALFIEYEEDIYKSDNQFLNESNALADSGNLINTSDVVYEHKIRYHKVKRGETMGSIAAKYGTTKSQIMKMNGFRSEKLKAGQTIKIDKIMVPVSPSQNPSTENPTDTTNTEAVVVAQNELKTIRHTVKAGETLYAISQAYKVSVDEIVKWNNLPSPQVYVGQVLVIYTNDPNAVAINLKPTNPPTNQTTAPKKYHTVKSGETLGAIAGKYGTTVAAIQKLNPGLKPNKLQIGQKIRVK